MTTLHLRKSIGRSPLRLGFLLIGLALALALACFALSPTLRAVNPPPDGGYPNQNTAEGENALFSLTTGSGNTAIGSFTLQNNATADLNTAYGWAALRRNTTGEGNIALGATAGQNLTTGSDNIDIDNAGVAGESNTIRFGTVGTHAN